METFSHIAGSVPGWRWSVRDTGWDYGLRALERYVEQHGTARPSTPTVHDGFPIGEWVRTQRATYQRGCLDPGRAARLEALPGWVWRTR